MVLLMKTSFSAGRLEDLLYRRPFSSCGDDLNLQPVDGGRTEVPHHQQVTIRRQDLRLRDDAVWKAVLTALCGNLRPCDLEACDWLVRLMMRHAPHETSRHVTVVEAEGRCQIFRLRQNLHRSSVSSTGDGFDALAPQSGAGWRQKAGALAFRASPGIEGVNRHPVLTGEQQAGEIHEVLLSHGFLCCSALVVAAVFRHPLNMITAG